MTTASMVAVFQPYAFCINVEGSRVEQARAVRAQPLTAESFGSSQDRVAREQAPSSPGDADLGQQVILKRREKVEPLTAAMSIGGFATNNAALSHDNAEHDFFLVGDALVSYQRRLTKDLLGDLSVRQSVFRYDRFDELDFESLNIGGGVTYVAHSLWDMAFSIRYNFNRLTDGSKHDEFFKNHTLTLGAFKTFPLAKAHYLYAGYASTFGWSDPVAPQRDEHGLYGGYHLNATRSLSADLFYRAAYFDYVNNRDDINQTVAASLKYEPTKWLNVTLSTSLGFNNSNRNQFDYNVLNGGGTLAASIRF